MLQSWVSTSSPGNPLSPTPALAIHLVYLESVVAIMSNEQGTLGTIFINLFNYYIQINNIMVINGDGHSTCTYMYTVHNKSTLIDKCVGYFESPES